MREEKEMSKKPFIFVTNDDGVSAKGLLSIVEAMREIAERIVVVAPEVPQSGKSQAITMYKPLTLQKVSEEKGLEIYSCSGTPADCVKMAFDHLLKDDFPDLVISGINHGSNAAISVLYSGTMGAAIEASVYNVPAIGLSVLNHKKNADFSGAVKYGVEIVKKVLAGGLTLPLCLNVNVPYIPKEEIKGIKVCRQTKGYWKEHFVTHQDPRGNDYYWLTGDFLNFEPDSEDSDEWALKNGYVSVVPVQTDMTSYEHLDPLKKLL